jgi:alkylation response protein AidB-like acyl-CoA dehydrogenase
MDRSNKYPWAVVQAMAQDGFMGLTITRAYGGGKRSPIDAILVVE